MKNIKLIIDTYPPFKFKIQTVLFSSNIKTAYSKPTNPPVAFTLYLILYYPVITTTSARHKKLSIGYQFFNY